MLEPLPLLADVGEALLSIFVKIVGK